MMRTIITYDRDGVKFRLNSFQFEVPDEQFDLIQAIKDAAKEYCATAEGQKTLSYNCGEFNYGDFDMHVPNEYCEKHGFSRVSTACADLIEDYNTSLVSFEENE